MVNRGRLMYIPKELLDELEETQMNFSIDKKSNCFKVIAENSRIGRQIKINLNFRDHKGIFKNKRKHG
jgi:uncharacterized surface anchored protein